MRDNQRVGEAHFGTNKAEDLAGLLLTVTAAMVAFLDSQPIDGPTNAGSTSSTSSGNSTSDDTINGNDQKSSRVAAIESITAIAAKKEEIVTSAEATNDGEVKTETPSLVGVVEVEVEAYHTVAQLLHLLGSVSGRGAVFEDDAVQLSCEADLIVRTALSLQRVAAGTLSLTPSSSTSTSVLTVTRTPADSSSRNAAATTATATTGAAASSIETLGTGAAFINLAVRAVCTIGFGAPAAINPLGSSGGSSGSSSASATATAAVKVATTNAEQEGGERDASVSAERDVANNNGNSTAPQKKKKESPFAGILHQASREALLFLADELRGNTRSISAGKRIVSR
jgi:hypothetical protein